jgi:Zn-dependent protease
VNQLSPELSYVVVSISIVLLSLTVHEAAHAWTANRLGDPTARQLGRISLNPLVHIDLIGTVILPLLAAISNLPIIGWAKPVPVDTRRLRQPRRDFMLVAAAGPASNILLAVGGSILIRLLSIPTFGRSPWLEFVEINILLAVFNLVPIPPLDGGNVLAGLLPPAPAATFNSLRPFGFIILYALMFTGTLSAIIMPPARVLWSLLIS